MGIKKLRKKSFGRSLKKKFKQRRKIPKPSRYPSVVREIEADRRRERKAFSSPDGCAECEHCGAPFRARPGAASYCGLKCRFWSKVEKPKRGAPKRVRKFGPKGECWMWTASVRNDAGYGQIQVGGNSVYAHLVAYMLNGGKIEDQETIIRHSCKQPLCVNPDHLKAGTAKDYKDCEPRRARGADISKNRSSTRLTETIVRSILRDVADGAVQSELALHYEVSANHISAIVAGTRWSHVKRPKRLVEMINARVAARGEAS